MFSDLLNLLASLGLCWILMYSYVMNWWRKQLIDIPIFKKFITCALCVGFWTGLAVYIITHQDKTFSRIDGIIFALASSGFCWIMEMLRMWLDSICYFIDPEDK